MVDLVLGCDVVKGPSKRHAPLAQLDRATDFESVGRRFESFGVRPQEKHSIIYAGCGE